ncbi:PAS domain-containing sensor histidine kinase [Pontibacter harenae]|uniref:PAS domain-containing sensor histidine kinase n=1 Tax=Pontibacter harenae TaxID=2894083 RepID=UPI001E49D1DF|nr:PAS domain-containing sensor histidine kinase [Pontibacter harenae]MCC9168778.1 PAS domain-containing protein [Pontibacter harenae]
MNNTLALQTHINFEQLFQVLPGQIILFSPELIILAANDAYLQVTHTTREDIVGKPLLEAFPERTGTGMRRPEYSPDYTVKYAIEHKVACASPVIRYDIARPQGNGHRIEKRYWKLSSKPVLNEFGEVEYVIHEAHDVTEQQRTEQEAKSAQHHLKLMSAAAGAATWEYEVSSQKLVWSESYRDIYGNKHTPLEVSADTWDRLVHPDDYPTVRAHINDTIAQKKKTWTGEYRYQRADGTYVEIADHGYIIYNEQGSVIRMMGSLVDITKQKEQEKQLKESKQRFERVAMVTNDVVWDWNLKDDSIWWNEGFKTCFGYSEEEIEPTIDSWTTRVRPEDLDRVKASINAVINSNETKWQDEYRFRCADGTYKRILDQGYVIRDEDGNAVRLIGAMLDITEKRRVEQELATTMSRLQQVMESLPLMTWTATPDGALNYYNQRWYDLTGSTFEELQAWGWEKFIHPDDYERTKNKWLESVRTGKPFTDENRWKVGKDGTYRWFLARGVPTYNSEGEIALWVGSHTDIEDEKALREQVEESEKKFRFLIESIPQMVWSANPDGYIDYTNYRWYEYTKMDETSLGLNWMPAIHPDEAQALMDTWMHCVSTGENLDFEVRFKDMEANTYRWFLLRAEPMRNSEGQIIKWFGTATDLHDQKMLREQLQESEKQFRFLAESIPQMVWTTDEQGNHDYFNRRWVEYTGMSLEKSKGINWVEILHPDDQERTKERWRYSLQTGDYYEIEYRFKNGRDGSYRWFLGQAIPMRDDNGNIVKWFGTCTDIEDHKRAEEELVEKNLELQRTNQDLDSFVYTASHDLKLPIVNMAGIFEELTKHTEFKDPDAPRMIAMFNKSLKQLHSTIHELSEVVKIQKQKLKNLEQIDLNELTEDVKVSIQDVLKESGAEVTTDFSQVSSIPFTKSSLKSIFYNLLSNAIKYRSHDRTAKIHLSTSYKGEYIELKVQDNGLGIDINKHHNKLFQMFKRFHNHVNGSGLGLYIVNRLLTNNGGYINIDSKLNEGTTFFLYFAYEKE